jgi:hypothetical protein
MRGVSSTAFSKPQPFAPQGARAMRSAKYNWPGLYRSTSYGSDWNQPHFTRIATLVLFAASFPSIRLSPQALRKPTTGCQPSRQTVRNWRRSFKTSLQSRQLLDSLNFVISGFQKLAVQSRYLRLYWTKSRALFLRPAWNTELVPYLYLFDICAILYSLPEVHLADSVSDLEVSAQVRRGPALTGSCYSPPGVPFLTACPKI